MGCILKLNQDDVALLVRESYATIKKRLLDSTDFIEVFGIETGKVIFNKNAVVAILKETSDPKKPKAKKEKA